MGIKKEMWLLGQAAYNKCEDESGAGSTTSLVDGLLAENSHRAEKRIQGTGGWLGGGRMEDRGDPIRSCG